MRISDWSSDVCSSDLRRRPKEDVRERRYGISAYPGFRYRPRCSKPAAVRRAARRSYRFPTSLPPARTACPSFSLPVSPLSRSEEHTSELQSLMRISYAVFCLKKKKNQPSTICTKKKTHTIKTLLQLT